MKEHVMGAAYEFDLVAWANEQAALLRSGKLSAIDALNIAEEIEDVGRSEQHRLMSRLAVLLAHLLKWHFQPRLRSNSWRNRIREQRKAIARQLRKSPSLKHVLDDEAWLEQVWSDAVQAAATETGLEFPSDWIWTVDEVVAPDFLPD